MEINKEQIIKSLKILAKQPPGLVYKDEEVVVNNSIESKTLQSFSQSKACQNVKISSGSDKSQLLDQLKYKHENCTGCPLATQGRTQVVFGIGNHDTKLMFVGEGPGRDEDKQGIPFVGRAGMLLTKIIEAMGLKRDQIYISNVVKCRPPNNRTPLPTESNTCKQSILFKEIEIIKPQIICALGAAALKALLGDELRISRARGNFYEFRGCVVMPTYHPAYLLRNPAEKRAVWEDMKKIMEKLNQ
jgi:uracil-DNA glycosylase